MKKFARLFILHNKNSTIQINSKCRISKETLIMIFVIEKEKSITDILSILIETFTKYLS